MKREESRFSFALIRPVRWDAVMTIDAYTGKIAEALNVDCFLIRDCVEIVMQVNGQMGLR